MCHLAGERKERLVVDSTGAPVVIKTGCWASSSVLLCLCFLVCKMGREEQYLLLLVVAGS